MPRLLVSIYSDEQSWAVASPCLEPPQRAPPQCVPRPGRHGRARRQRVGPVEPGGAHPRRRL